MNQKENAIKRIKDIIVQNYNPEKIILFGSHARNEQDENSDIDIMIVSDREKQIPRYKRGLKLRILLSEIKVKKDILFYTKSELKRFQKIKNSFSHHVLKEGKVIYG